MRHRREIEWALEAPGKFWWRGKRLVPSEEVMNFPTCGTHRYFDTKRRCWQRAVTCPAGAIVHRFFRKKGKQYWHRWEIRSPGEVVDLGCEPLPVDDEENSPTPRHL